MESPHTSPKSLRLLYFWVGILATFTYRAIIVLNHYSAAWVTVFWYVGTVGFIIYFSHRYRVSQKRAKLVAQYNLDEKVKTLPNLSTEERDALVYLLTSLESSKERWNFIFIFTTSGLALLIGIILDFLI